MQFPGQLRPPMGILFDANLAADLDSLLALTFLYMLDNKNECRMVCGTTSLHNVHSAALYDVYQKIYGGRPAAIGMRTNTMVAADSTVLMAAIEKQTTNVRTVIDTAEPAGMLRNMLAAQHDGNATVICCGPTENLQDLLRLPTALPLVKAKVAKLYIVGEDLKPIDGWPSPTVLVPLTAARDLQWLPKADDFAWNETHPLLQALKANPTAALNRAAMLAVLLSVRGKDFALPLTSQTAAAADKVFAEVTPLKPIPRARPVRPPA